MAATEVVMMNSKKKMAKMHNEAYDQMKGFRPTSMPMSSSVEKKVASPLKTHKPVKHDTVDADGDQS